VVVLTGRIKCHRRQFVRLFVCLSVCLIKAPNSKTNYKFGAKPNVSPPGALSPIGGKFRGGKIFPVAKSRGPHLNVLAYAKRALLT